MVPDPLTKALAGPHVAGQGLINVLALTPVVPCLAGAASAVGGQQRVHAPHNGTAGCWVPQHGKGVRRVALGVQLIAQWCARYRHVARKQALMQIAHQFACPSLG